jgi:chemotaxis protein histidine kinase CheA
LQSLHSTEWRVKTAALECLVQLATTVAPKQVHMHIPTLIPACTNQVWDTKAQVSKTAKSALLAICGTNVNTDIKPAIPAVVNAICKPSETNKAVSELMGTTFIVPVDASTLAILCPVLARALKEKLAIHKRAACIVISNMSKLVETPSAVAPFGSLLVPELQKVAANVQFEEIRDESLKALKNLTKALGDQYNATEATSDEGDAEKTTKLTDAETAAAELAALQAEQARVEAEQKRIQEERERIAAEDEAHRLREIEERKKFKEAMDAQRELDRIAAEEAAAAAADEKQRKEMLKLSTKGEGGKCQGCGLKKCLKTCSFYKQ